MVCTLFAVERAGAERLPDTIEKVLPSVVGVGAAFPPRVPTKGKPPRRLLGSGFVVEHDTKTFIVTNAHVLPIDLSSGDLERLAIFVPKRGRGQVRFAEVVAEDLDHDLAVLSYEGARLPGLALALENARPGERIAFTGFPIGAVLGLYPSTHEGIVSSITPIARPADSGGDLSSTQLRHLRAPFDVYQLDAIAYPGNSGSVVYRQSTGNVVGVMNSVFVKESRENLLASPSGISYAVPIEHLRQLLSEAR